MFLWNWMFSDFGSLVVEIIYNVIPIGFVFFLVEAVKHGIQKERYWPWALGAGFSLLWMMSSFLRFMPIS